MIEWETTDPSKPGSASIPFLDLLIHRSPEGLTFSIYRKPTSTDLYTHYYYSHSLATKKGVLISLFLRAYRLCDEVFISPEINYIRSAFSKLKYPKWLIDQALSTAIARYHNPVIRQPQRNAAHHLALIEHPSLKSLRPALSKIGISTSFSSGNTLRKQLSRTGPKAPVHVSGVYTVECKVATCPNGVYYGESGRNLDKRIYEHRKDIREAVTSNALFSHMRDNTGHQFDLDGAKIVFKSKSKAKRQLVESSLIANSVNCNLKPGDFPVCKLTASVVIKCLKLDTNKTCPNTTSSTRIAPINSGPAIIAPTIPTSPVNPFSTTSSLPRLAPIQPLSDNAILSSTSLHNFDYSTPTPSLVASSIASPMLQSQARALSQTYSQTYTSIIRAASSCPSPTPIAYKTRKRTSRPLSQVSPAPRPPPPPSLLSPYSSPTTSTGAVPKRSSRRVTPYPVSNHSPSTTPQPYVSSPIINSSLGGPKSKKSIIPYRIPSK